MSNKNIPAEIVKHYVELNWKLREASELPYGEESDKYEYLETHYTYYTLPKGLSDDDKLICMLLLLHQTERGLVKKELKEAFGWSKYKSGKIARQNPYCNTVTLLCENGGYGGIGYALDWDMHRAMLAYCAEHYPCTKCTKLSKWESQRFPRKDAIGYCSLDTQCQRYCNSGCVNGRYELMEEHEVCATE
ncbi:hypothetical protein M2451_002604 [Dysgonomonas sp. PFB1-18]|uniref:hypothetical protein n=1 Tax=unclassified Dysgonomonas TaxID=2630389 RepID=UPI0024730807|nr:MULTISPECIES: hypothetical protein [unclassified Dysgonomonas]MDH6308085.1 hypothetical protein [Dysgonomonas sp. PF1-14]MDH6339624.1 hypothetical protein [Dysgonomonas sp. PF1-16]MDH6381275.1 hypothetical protein [Dysgonomonas sp. PFB1-18]MDH6398487.1 hypothetical protein [Dysgonomonas sp. PF1-23]